VLNQKTIPNIEARNANRAVGSEMSVIYYRVDGCY